MSDIDGTVEVLNEDGQTRVRVISAHVYEYEYPFDKKMVPIVQTGDVVNKGSTLLLPPEQAKDLLDRKAKSKSNTISKRAIAKVADSGISAEAEGVVNVLDGRIILRSEVEDVSEYPMPPAVELRVQSGQSVLKGDQLTDGSLNPQDILRLRGREALQKYVVREVQNTYRMVGVAVNDKHIEVIIRQMLRREVVDSAGDTAFLPGSLVDRSLFEHGNAEVVAAGNRPAEGHPVLLGVTKASLNNESFLAAASFQDTTRVLTEAVVEGKTDHLFGLKENVIIGKLIPAGTGWGRYKSAAIEAGESTDVLIDTEAMDMSPGDYMGIEDDSAADVQDSSGAGAGGPRVLEEGSSDAAGEDILAGIDTVDEDDQFSGFLRNSDEVKVDELSVDARDVSQENPEQQ